MINYDLDQQQKSAQEQAQLDLNLLGITDGSHGYPLQIKFMHESAYINGYVIGISQWAQELERREQENWASSAVEF